MSNESLPLRRSARLMIVSPAGRLLLFHYHDEHGAPFWATAGGELVGEETYEEAAARELREETGFDAAIGPQIRERSAVYAVARSAPARWEERYFLVRTADEAVPSRKGWTEEERHTIAECRWWSLAELRGAGVSLKPAWISELLASQIVR